MYRQKRPLPPPILTERNLDRLGFFSIQTRIPHELAWESQFCVAGRTVHVRGEGTRGRPHGVDTDIMLGVEQLFIEQDCPEDNWLHTTPNALREAALMKKNGRAFARIREGLLRIWSTGFIVQEGWTDASGQPVRFNSAFRLLEELRYWDRDTDELPELLPDARLSIRLSAQLAASIRAGFTHTLRREVLSHLEQPHSRALYRLAEAHRYQDDGTLLKSLSVELMEWRSACGIRETKASKIMRTLDAAHEELTAAGYLTDLRVEGRGQSQRLEYIFRQEHDPDPALVQLLRGYHVGAPRAVQLAAQYPERVENAIRYFEQVRHEGRQIRNPGGFLADLIGHPEKYELVVHALPEEKEQKHRQEAKQLIEKSEAQAIAKQEAERARLLNLSSKEQWKEKGKGLIMSLKGALSSKELQLLEERCQAGDISAVDLASEVAKAQATMTMQEFIADLKPKLGSANLTL